MKLGIRRNTLRLRVSRPEAAQILARGRVEDATCFAPGARLTYRLEAGTEGGFRAEFAQGTVSVRVRVPRDARPHRGPSRVYRAPSRVY